MSAEPRKLASRVFAGLGSLIFILFSAAGCGFGYYCHLASGQARILLRALPVKAVLADANLDSTQRQRLLLTQDIRAFAVHDLGLQGSWMYTRYYDTGGKPLSYNLSASPPDRFEPYLWHFPLIGDAPYKGFFSLDRAHDEERKLAARGLDVYLRPVPAYSTLGYLPDPILSSMLDYPPDELADLIIHELTHCTVFAPGHTDFNESLATYVGRTGSLQFLSRRFGPQDVRLSRARKARRDEQRFRAFMACVVDSLDSLYALGHDRATVLRERTAVFARAKLAYKSLRDSFELLDYDGFLDWRVNNARLLSYRRYNTHPALFDSLLDTCSGSLRRVVTVAGNCADEEDPWSCLRARVRPVRIP